MTEMLPVEHIAEKIYLIRGQKVMLDRDLAELYGVKTKQLKRAVRRNIERFPDDFMFELTKKELEDWRYQFGTSNSVKMGLRYPPMAFTEQGVAMLSSILRSGRAVQVNIQIIRVFIKLRQIVLENEDIRKELGELKKQTDERFQIVFETLDHLLSTEKKPKRKIGFTVKEKIKAYGKNKMEPAVNGFNMTPQARRRWEAIPGDIRMKILNNVWCVGCRNTTGIGEVSGKIEKGMLVLRGGCTKCGGEVARVME